MQIKFILAAAGTLACLSGGICGTQAIAEDTKFSEDGMAKNSKRDICSGPQHTAREGSSQGCTQVPGRRQEGSRHQVRPEVQVG